MASDDLSCDTDGLEECVNESGHILGESGLTRRLAGGCPDAPSSVFPHILDRLRSMSPQNLDDDDVIIMLICRNGASVSPRTNLLAPFRDVSNLVGGGWRI